VRRVIKKEDVVVSYKHPRGRNKIFIQKHHLQ
jgi:hypothetical protein